MLHFITNEWLLDVRMAVGIARHTRDYFINAMRCMVDITLNLSQTVGRVELPKAANSGFHASLPSTPSAGLIRFPDIFV
jgi:hypothetical protein